MTPTFPASHSRQFRQSRTSSRDGRVIAAVRSFPQHEHSIRGPYCGVRRVDAPALNATVQPLRILVTNDDGVDAPGIKPLAMALAADRHDVVVVAPTGDRSGSGAAIGKLFGVEPPPIVRHTWPEL